VLSAGAKAEAWDLLIHADVSLYLYLSLSLYVLLRYISAIEHPSTGARVKQRSKLDSTNRFVYVIFLCAGR